MKESPRPARKKRKITNSVAPATHWQLQTAKARFSEVFRRTRTEGPQWITRQGKEAAVMLPAEDFENLTARARQPRSLVQFFAESPLAKSGIKIDRDQDYGRPVDL